ncbi:MAG: UDP binding domain-containing protein, partial [Candidatus Thorarchaeota archaeon]
LVENALKASGRSLQGAIVTILGAAYLENSDDTRNTPAAPLVGALIAKGAEVRIHDPYVRDWDFGPHEILTDLQEAARDSDCLALVTKHEDYLSLDLSDLKKVMRTPTVVDGRNVFDQQKMVENDFEYRCVGKAGISRS